MPLPTLLQVDSFKFLDEVPESQKEGVLGKRAIDVIIDILRKKLQQNGKSIFDHMYFLDGRTGSGKSTTLPMNILLALGKSIQVTQPKKALTSSNVKNICEIPGNTQIIFGKNIGFQNGDESFLPEAKPSILFITTELLTMKLLMKEIPLLPEVIIVDEVHELDNPMIRLLFAIKKYLYNPHIELSKKPFFIFQSATINIPKMMKYFINKDEDIKECRANYLMVGKVEGTRNFPVEVRNDVVYGTMDFSKRLLLDYVRMCMKSQSVYNAEGDIARDILVFCQGIKFYISMIIDMKRLKNLPYKIFYTEPRIDHVEDMRRIEAWRKQYEGEQRILVTYWISTTPTYIMKVFDGPYDMNPECRKNEIKIIFSTNALQAGKTIDSLYMSINNHIRNFTKCNPIISFKEFNSGNNKLPLIQYYDDASSNTQKNGRVGRKAPGIYISLMPKEVEKKLNMFFIFESVNTMSYAETYRKLIVLPDFNLCKYNDFYVGLSFDTLYVTYAEMMITNDITIYGDVLQNDISYLRNTGNMAIWLFRAKELYIDGKCDLLSALYNTRFIRRELRTFFFTSLMEYKQCSRKLTDKEITAFVDSTNNMNPATKDVVINNKFICKLQPEFENNDIAEEVDEYKRMNGGDVEDNLESYNNGTYYNNSIIDFDFDDLKEDETVENEDDIESYRINKFKSIKTHGMFCGKKIHGGVDNLIIKDKIDSDVFKDAFKVYVNILKGDEPGFIYFGDLIKYH